MPPNKLKTVTGGIFFACHEGCITIMLLKKQIFPLWEAELHSTKGKGHLRRGALIFRLLLYSI